MQHIIEANGNLTLVLDAGEADDIARCREQASSDLDAHVLSSLLDASGYIGNNRLQLVSPKSIGALTEAPILTDDLEHTEDGDTVVRGRVWWFPDYMVKDATHILMDTGKVTFAEFIYA